MKFKSTTALLAIMAATGSQIATANTTYTVDDLNGENPAYGLKVINAGPCASTIEDIKDAADHNSGMLEDLTASGNRSVVIMSDGEAGSLPIPFHSDTLEQPNLNLTSYDVANDEPATIHIVGNGIEITDASSSLEHINIQSTTQEDILDILNISSQSSIDSIVTSVLVKGSTGLLGDITINDGVDLNTVKISYVKTAPEAFSCLTFTTGCGSTVDFGN